MTYAAVFAPLYQRTLMNALVWESSLIGEKKSELAVSVMMLFRKNLPTSAATIISTFQECNATLVRYSSLAVLLANAVVPIFLIELCVKVAARRVATARLVLRWTNTTFVYLSASARVCMKDENFPPVMWICGEMRREALKPGMSAASCLW